MPDLKQANVYSYKVEMVVQIISEDEVDAKKKLDAEGGYMTKRTVTLIQTLPLYNGDSSQINV